MTGKMLFAASTRSHILAFHIPYLHAFRADGWTIHVAWGGPDGDVPYTDRTIPLPLKKSIWSPGNFRAARILRKTIKTEDYDAVIVHTTLAAFFTRLAVLGLKKRPKVINMVHGYLVDGQTGRLKRELLLAAERLTAPVTDLVLAMNRWDYETALRLHLGKQVESVPGIGVDFARLDNSSAHDTEELRKAYAIPPRLRSFLRSGVLCQPESGGSDPRFKTASLPCGSGPRWTGHLSSPMPGVGRATWSE